MSAIIKVQNLGKKYTLRHEHPERYVALRDVMARQAKKLFSFPPQWRARASKLDFEEFWALKDLDFEIQAGDRLGIIGRNGAGKSTLLKILSRITAPSTGRIELNGRVASLLEVGTGFHPELSGRENIFLNGAILGMSRLEIRRKFDEIVDFSGVEKFLDTPVKRYSSGMYVRLAFAVAAHLEPEILVVDEVLAVGDAEFQKKCLGKMEDVSRNEGRTVIFVSHNMGVLSQLCMNCIWINSGKLIEIGSTSEVINNYASSASREIEAVYKNKSGTKNKIEEITIFGNEKIANSFLLSETITIQLEFILELNLREIDVGISVLNSMKQKIFTSHYSPNIRINNEGRYKVSCKIPSNILVPGIYFIDAAVFLGKALVYDYQKEAIKFEIIDSGFELSNFADYGFVNIKCSWDLEN